jgi:hypothetical protein
MQDDRGKRGLGSTKGHSTDLNQIVRLMTRWEKFLTAYGSHKVFKKEGKIIPKSSRSQLYTIPPDAVEPDLTPK